MSLELMQKNIEKAQKTVKEKKGAVSQGSMRQNFHFMPEVGWMNDPNGLIFFRNQYHYFFQYYPYGEFWGSMYWGHAVSDDLIHWQYLPPALAPSEHYDNHPQGGCFSGSAIAIDDRLFLMYTASSNQGRGMEQYQCIAWSDDGIHFEKYEGNPVLTAPNGILSGDFRDPKVWEHEGAFYMICGASRNKAGEVLLYKSLDMLHWDYINVMYESRGEWGEMFECPDFFKMGDQYVLTFSPVKSGEHTAVYCIGNFDYRTGKFEPDTCREIDWGFDFYAPQSFLAKDGRRIMISWANEWQWMPLFKDWGPTYKEGWCGFFTIPREVRPIGDRLEFKPIRELDTICHNLQTIDSLVIGSKACSLKIGDGVHYRLKLQIDLKKTTADQCILDLRVGDRHRTRVIVDFKHGELSVDRNKADGWSQGVSKSTWLFHDRETAGLDIISDQSSIEIYTDDYQNVQSNNIFAGKEDSGVCVQAEGGEVVLEDIRTWQINLERNNDNEQYLL